MSKRIKYKRESENYCATEKVVLLNSNVQPSLRLICPQIFIAKLLLLITLIMCCGLATIFTAYPIKILFQIGIGLLMAHATELGHQCIHKTATGRAKWDNLLGMLLNFPSGTSFWYYRWFHLWHHRYNGTLLDKESFNYTYQMMENPSRYKRFLGFAKHLSMVSHYRNALQEMFLAICGKMTRKFRQITPEMSASTSRKIQRDYQIMSGMLCMLLLISLLFQTFIILEIWLIPLLIAWGPAHAMIELPEHWKCDRINKSAFLNTRSIKANGFARWYTNNNCNHIGHHYDMSVPMENLPAFEDILIKTDPFKYHETSYTKFYLKFLGLLYKG